MHGSFGNTTSAGTHYTENMKYASNTFGYILE